MRRLVSLAFAISALASPLAAQSHPDFSGKWVLDPKTAEGPMAPSAMTVVATQDAKTLKLETAATSQFGEQKSAATVNLDGSPSKNNYETPNGPIELTSVGTWDGATFVITTKADISGQSFSQTDSWSLDSAGKSAHVQRDLNFSGQTITMKLVFNKQ
jgi:hypothetical protein